MVHCAVYVSCDWSDELLCFLFYDTELKTTLDKSVLLIFLQGKDEFMGRCVESPVVKLKGQGSPAPRLLWEPVKKGTEDGGEILVALELFLVRLND